MAENREIKPLRNPLKLLPENLEREIREKAAERCTHLYNGFCVFCLTEELVNRLLKSIKENTK